MRRSLTNVLVRLTNASGLLERGIAYCLRCRHRLASEDDRRRGTMSQHQSYSDSKSWLLGGFEGLGGSTGGASAGTPPP